MNKFTIFVIFLSFIYVTEAGIRCSLGQWACDASCAGIKLLKNKQDWKDFSLRPWGFELSEQIIKS